MAKNLKEGKSTKGEKEKLIKRRRSKQQRQSDNISGPVEDEQQEEQPDENQQEEYDQEMDPYTQQQQQQMEQQSALHSEPLQSEQGENPLQRLADQERQRNFELEYDQEKSKSRRGNKSSGRSRSKSRSRSPIQDGSNSSQNIDSRQKKLKPNHSQGNYRSQEKGRPHKSGKDGYKSQLMSDRDLKSTRTKDTTRVRTNIDQESVLDPDAALKSSLVGVLCLISFLSMSAFSQMSPFYPLKAKEKGVDAIWVGFIFGTMALMQILSSFVVGKYLHKTAGRGKIIMVGSFLIICQTSLLGYLHFEDDQTRFLLLSFFAQILGGFGAGANSTASMAILSSFEANEREENIGYIEAANGIGMLFGPLLGALLYTIGGYFMPFATFTVIYLLSFPYIILTLNRSRKIYQRNTVEPTFAGVPFQPKEEQAKEEIELGLLLQKPRFVFGLLSQMILNMSIQYLAPNLAVHLHFFGYSAEQIGVAYGIPAILYACTCPFMYLLTQRIRKRGIILIGFILITVAMLMIGGSDSLFEFQKQPVFIFLGLCIIGLSAGMISIPVMPEMLESIEQDPELSEKYDIEAVENICSGLFISFQSMGEALGPIASSFLTDQFGFQVSQEIYCLVLTIFFTSYFILCGNFAMFGKADTMEFAEPEEVEELIPENKKEEARSFFNCFRNRESINSDNDPDRIKIEQQLQNKMQKLESAQQRYNDLKQLQEQKATRPPKKSRR